MFGPEWVRLMFTGRTMRIGESAGLKGSGRRATKFAGAINVAPVHGKVERRAREKTASGTVGTFSRQPLVQRLAA